MSKETDPLRKWMKEKGVWQLDLSKLLENEDVSTLKSFQQLEKNKVSQLIEQAKKTGFMHGAKLKELHGGFPKKKKKAKPAVNQTVEKKEKPKDPEVLKREARPKMEAYMRKEGIWQIDLFDLLTDKYEIYTPEQFDEYRTDPDWCDEFLTDAKHCGVMGNQAVTLSVLCGKKKKANKKKPKKVASTEAQPKQKDHDECKIEARPVLEKYLRDNNVWQIDLFDMMVDKYQIYAVQDFMEYQEDEDWVDEFLLEAKHVGVMGQKVKHLEKLCGRRKNVNSGNKKKKPPAKAANEAPTEKKLSPEEIESKARSKMEPFMNKKGFWNKDLFVILLQWDVYQPSDLKNLSKQDRKEVLHEAKQKGLMGQKMKAFKEYLSGL